MKKRFFASLKGLVTLSGAKGLRACLEISISPAGTSENSPAIHCRVSNTNKNINPSPVGTTDKRDSVVPTGLENAARILCRAILKSPYGTEK